MKEPTIIEIKNYNGKNITIIFPSDATIEMFREANFSEILGGDNTFSNIEIHCNGEGITMEVENIVDLNGEFEF